MKFVRQILMCSIALSHCTAGTAIAKKPTQGDERIIVSNINSATKQKTDKKQETSTVSNSASNRQSVGSAVGQIQRTGEQIDWQVFSDGGGLSTTAGLQLFSVIGQTATGESTGGALRLQHGFLQNFLGSQSCCIGVTGNIDCDAGSVVDITDLTVLIDHLFLSLAPLCCEASGNIDGDQGSIVDITDLTVLIDHLFISLSPTSACQ